MISKIFHLAVLTTALSNNNFTNTVNYPLIYHDSIDYSKITSFLSKINEGSLIVYDMCETLDETYSIISGSNKPDCNYNISYINNSDIIVHSIDTKITKFLNLEKKNFCKKEAIECGELTLILKLIHLIDSGILLAMENNINDLWINLEIIDFDEMYHLYKNSLTNMELLTNITLSKQKANVILTQEKYRLNKILTKTYFSKFTNKIEIWLGEPIKNTFTYTADTIGSFFGTILDKTLSNISIEFKIMIILVLFIYLRK